MTKEHTVQELVFMFWDRCAAEGRKAPRTYGLLAVKTTAGHAAGELVGWGVNRGYVESLLSRRQDAAAFEIQELEPE